MIRPRRADWRYAADVFARYRERPGSDFIARPPSLAYLSAVLHRYRPRTVVECGGGIGCIADAVLTHGAGVARVVSTEQNQFCLDALAEHLGHHDPARLSIVTSPAELAACNVTADLFIGDGEPMDGVFDTIRAGTIIFIDGTRTVFRQQLAEWLAARGLGLELMQYGVKWKRVWKVRNFIPRVVKRQRTEKGCWVGSARPLQAGLSPPTPKAPKSAFPRVATEMDRGGARCGPEVATRWQLPIG